MLKLNPVRFLRLISLRSSSNIDIRSKFNVKNYVTTSNLSQTKYITSTQFTRKDVNTLSEREYLVKIKNDPDIFGNEPLQTEPDEGDVKEEEFLSNPPTPSKRLSTKQYADIIKGLINKRQIKEAIDFVEIKMLKEDRVKPENYIYNLLLGGCGRVGYTKKAFSLYNLMKRRGLKITPGTYTALFNACANSPWPEDGLTRTKHLHNIMIEKHYEPNDTNYNSMIKAYGRCGDLKSAFCIVDEMIKRRMPVRDSTLNFLLQACITDKEAGFRHALLVWRQFMTKRIEPSIYTYNLLLRSIRDCGIGDLNATKDVMRSILPKNDLFLIESGDTQEINENSQEVQKLFETQTLNETREILKSSNEVLRTSNETQEIKTKDSDSLEIPETLAYEISVGAPKQSISEISLNRPNLLARTPHLGNIISLSEITKAEDRLLLVGGASGFLENMSENKCIPDVKTYSQLLDCVPNTLSSEKEIFAAMEKANVRPDVDFYNMIIKRRSLRSEYDGARDVLRLMKKNRYRPDLITYGVLALACRNLEEAESLIQEMKLANYRLNTEILGAMLKQGCYHHNFSYVLAIMELCIKEDVPPNKLFMEHLEKFKKTCKLISNDVENKLSNNKSFQKGHQIFRLRYKTWLNEVKVEEEEIHPWQQFRQPTETDVRHYKDKEARFKPRHNSGFKVKTSKKYDNDKRRVYR